MVRPNAMAYLASRMDLFHQTFDVYTDADAAGNHFTQRVRIGPPGAARGVPPMDEAHHQRPRSGLTCIRAVFRPKMARWGGWSLVTGAAGRAGEAGRPRTGDAPAPGFDLGQTRALTFWARGERGGEVVEFFALGAGRDSASGKAVTSHPGSAAPVSITVSLTRRWRQYTIGLRARDLTRVVRGFGWVANWRRNRNRDITFFLDEISYQRPRLDEPRFILSYETAGADTRADRILRNTAFSHDNAVALLAFLANADLERARLVADALVYALEHDRFFDDGRLRNAYRAGDLTGPGAVSRAAPLPGHYDGRHKRWIEDSFQVSTHTGNVAWAMLALLVVHERTGGARYLEAARRMGAWVERRCRDTRGAGGYTIGFQGWEPAPKRLYHKSTEHNIDLYVAFTRLAAATSDSRWRRSAEHARRFLLAMWDPVRRGKPGKFWTGTLEDGVTINKEVVVLDVQAWALLALGEAGKPYRSALAHAEAHLRITSAQGHAGYDFNQDRDGVWYEGTAQMALAYYHAGDRKRWQELMATLRDAQQPGGGLPAASRDGVTTGLPLLDGGSWLLFKRPHIGATAWMALAERGVNPFWM